MQTTTANSPAFGKFRSFVWPIHGYEHKKLLPMFFLFFLISFVYNILRCMKVTLVVTAQGSGAEAIPFLKVWAVLPGALLLTYFYTLLARRYSREKVFYTILGFFLGFFTLFMLVLHPNRETLELVQISEFLQANLPEGFRGLISIVRHWPLSLFYVISEMWSAIVLSILFWGFANEITSIHEAKRFYAIFALGANSSGIFSGQCAQFLTMTHYNPNLPFGSEAWEQTLFLQLSMVLVIGIGIIALYRWVNQQIIKIEFHSNPKQESKKDITQNLSLFECFSHLAKSRYMVYIAILVVAYNIVYNLSDVLWTEQVKQRFPDASDFNSYINEVAFLTGIFATISALLLSGNVIRRYGWTATALITPAIWLLTGIGFLGCMLFSENSNLNDAIMIMSGIPIYNWVLVFGSAQICLGRAAKYTVFDESKEIAFIPLSKEDQRKGKAVVDGIASRFGKSGGSLMIQVLIILSGSLMSTIPFVAAIFIGCLILWMLAVRGLGKMVTHTIDKELIDERSATTETAQLLTTR